MCPTITLAELAAMTGKPEAWWRRNWLRMHLQHNFPRRLPGLWAWPRGTVAAWCRLGGLLPELPQPANQNAGPSDLEAATALLDRRFGLS